MAGLRHCRSGCIRAAFRAVGAGFQKTHRNRLRCFQDNHRKIRMDFVEGIWKEDPEGVKLEDSPSSKMPDIFLKATGWAPSGLEAADVDMLPISEPRPPVQDSGPEAGGWVLRCPQWPEDSRMTEEWGPPAAGPFAPTEIPHASSHGRSRARASRWLPRLGNERDKGPKLSLLKRKLELLLTEPERNKKKKQYVA